MNQSNVLPEEEVVFPSSDFNRDGAGREAPMQGPPPDAGAQAAYVDPAVPYLPHLDSDQARARWQMIQAGFVDDPRQSVSEAHRLVGELMQRIVESFTQERAALEQQWSKGEQVSTEDLRVCLQRYRGFFARLLPVTDPRR